MDSECGKDLGSALAEDLHAPPHAADHPRVTAPAPSNTQSNSPRLGCTLSLDLDDAWTYVRAAGRPGWEGTPTVIPAVCQRLRALLDRHGLRITLFVIARDLEDPARVAAIRPLVEAGHEIGCHSYGHEPTFALLGPDELRAEITRAVRLCEDTLGVRPVGFRAPGFACNPHLGPILRDLGFRYDGSTLATWLGPLARLYYFASSGLDREERRRRGAMFGRLRDVLQSQRARPMPGVPEVLQVPVTTVPVLRAPFHFSYVAWLSRWSRPLARAWLGLGLGLCRLVRLPPSYLLHSLDFVGAGEHPDLGFFPGMDLPWERKRELLDGLCARLARDFATGPMGPFADGVLGAVRR